ncbi:MAG: hypothetical protein ABFS18_00225 [Thermodesulfobacteriota bacterium]
METKGTKRVLIPGNGQNNQAIAMAMKLGIELSKKVANDIEGVALVVPTKKSIRQPLLETVVSKRIAMLLHKGQQVPMGCGLGLRAETTRTYKTGSHKDIVIAIGADSKMMNKVDAMSNLHTIIAVPQKDGALDGWAATWSPLIPGAKKKVEGQKKNNKVVGEQLLSDKVVETALSALAGSIDLSKRGLARQDRRQLENMIKLLRQNNHQEDPANVLAWAVKSGWHPETADELVKIWENVFSLKDSQRIKDAA